jgi:hypothetical protein
MPESLVRGIVEAHATKTTALSEEVPKPKADVVQFARSKSLVS